MKILIVLCIISYSLVVTGQQHDWPPLVLLDSVKIELAKTLFSPDKIADLKIDGSYIDTAAHIHGKIFIRSKKDAGFVFLTVAGLKQRYADDVPTKALFMIDNELLKDSSTFRIDSSYILKAEIINTVKINYLELNTPNLAIIKIFTKTKENLDKQNQLRIRGTAAIAARYN